MIILAGVGVVALGVASVELIKYSHKAIARENERFGNQLTAEMVQIVGDISNTNAWAGVYKECGVKYNSTNPLPLAEINKRQWLWDNKYERLH